MDWLINLAHWFGSAVCHQWPDHSYFIAGVELPLCARCTGMYVGALLTILFHAWRHPRAAGTPRTWTLAALVFFFFAWAGDGVNSFASLIPNAPHLYPPQNILRLTTGALMGITIGTLISLMFNSLVWRNAHTEPLVASPREFLALLGIQAVFILLVNSQWSLLLAPLTLTSLIAILTLNGGLMAALAASLRNRLAITWREALPALAVGLVIALSYLDLLAFGRLLLGRIIGTTI